MPECNVCACPRMTAINKKAMNSKKQREGGRKREGCVAMGRAERCAGKMGEEVAGRGCCGGGSQWE